MKTGTRLAGTGQYASTAQQLGSCDSSEAAVSVLICGDVPTRALYELLVPFGLDVRAVGTDEPIPGSYWGEPEAGLVGNALYVRPDTPVHSALHEACHFICMDDERRAGLHRDAGGDVAEENAVCYLQILLADAIPGMGRARMQADMDAWGYTFRLGAAGRWFEEDAADARAWLAERGLLEMVGRIGRSPQPTGRHDGPWRESPETPAG